MKIKALALMLGIVFGGMVVAGELEDILEKHYEALGGAKALDGTKNLVINGKIIINSPQGDMEMPFKVFMKDGTKVRWDATMQGMTMAQAIDGDTGWSLNPMMGTEAQDMNEDDIKNMKNVDDFL